MAITYVVFKEVMRLAERDENESLDVLSRQSVGPKLNQRTTATTNTGSHRKKRPSFRKRGSRVLLTGTW
jgi:hypothetical protein